jgi:hypothetical protein
MAANPAATAAAFAAFLAVPLTFERVIAPERFVVFAGLFGFALPRFAVLDRFKDFFEERFDAFAMLPLKCRPLPAPAVMKLAPGYLISAVYD